MIKALFISLILSVTLFASGINYAKPIPTIENPRKIIFQINQDNQHELYGALNNVSNVLAEYSPELVQVKVVAFGEGIALLKAKNNPFIDRIKWMMDVGVDFVACGRTMRTKNLQKSDLIDGISFVDTGLTEVIERQADGWNYVRP